MRIRITTLLDGRELALMILDHDYCVRPVLAAHRIALAPAWVNEPEVRRAVRAAFLFLAVWHGQGLRSERAARDRRMAISGSLRCCGASRIATSPVTSQSAPRWPGLLEGEDSMVQELAHACVAITEGPRGSWT